MDSPNRGHLSGVKEEPYTRDSLEDQYFRMWLPNDSRDMSRDLEMFTDFGAQSTSTVLKSRTIP